MICEKCGSEMWDNTQNKLNPRQPDYKCKNKETCGHAVWLKPKADVQQSVQTANKGNYAPKKPIANGNPDTVKTMLMAYAKDLVVARLQSGEELHTAKSTVTTFRMLYREVLEPFKMTFKEENIQPQDIVDEFGGEVI